MNFFVKIKLILTLLYFNNIILCQSASQPPVREFVSKRHDNGLKKLVLVFEGEGINEILVAKYGFYEDGLKKFIEPHEDNKLNGKSTYWFPNGQLSAEINYKAGKKNGSITTYFEDGSPKVQGNFTNDLENGQFTVWNEYDGSRTEYICKDGERNGSYMKFNGDGNKIIAGNYLAGLRDGQWNYEDPFYFDGKKTTGKSQINYKGDEPNGIAKFYHLNGKIQSTGNYTNGRKNGAWKFYDQNGKKKSTGFYEEGYESGVWEWFDEYEKLKTRISYKKGKKHGERLDWNNVGIKVFEGNYKNDKLEGKAINWNEYGILFNEGYYENNLRNGLWAYYDEKSLVTEEILYQRGKIAEETKYSYFENGNLKTKKYDKYDGIDLNKYGSFKSSQEIIKTDVSYFINGKVKSLSNYNYEFVNVGKWILYDESGNIDSAMFHFDNSWFESYGYYGNDKKEVKKGTKAIDIFTAVQYDYWKFENDNEKSAYELLVEDKENRKKKREEMLAEAADKKYKSMIPKDRKIVLDAEKKLREVYINPEYEIYSYFGFYEGLNSFDTFLLRKNDFDQILKAKKYIAIKDHESKDLFMSEKNRKGMKWLGSDYFSVKSFSGKTKKDKRKKISGAHVIVLKDWAND